jgi:hypothetical protein
MKHRGFILASLILLIIPPPLCFARQHREYADKELGYAITLIGGWEKISYRDAFGRRRDDFVLGEAGKVTLKVSREPLGARTLAEFVRKEVDDLKLSQPDCIWDSREPFKGGAIAGFRVALFYIEGGRRTVSTYYYLERSGVVWVLRFSGLAGSLDNMRETTDRMARSFHELAAFEPER